MKNAVWKKEMQLSVRKKKTVAGMLIFNLLLIVCTLFCYHLLFEKGQIFTYANYSEMKNLYEIIMVVEVFLVAFITPAVTAGSIVGEREKQTLDILFTTSLSSGNIILGKLVSSISTLMLYLVSALPVLFIVLSVGGLKVWDIPVCMLYIFVAAIYIGSFGIFFSTVFKKSVVATVWSYGSVLFVMVASYFIIYFADLLNGKEEIDLPMCVICVLVLFYPVASVTNLLTLQLGVDVREWSSFWCLEDSWNWIDHGSLELWFVLAVAVQLVTAAILLISATKRLNPVKDKKRKG